MRNELLRGLLLSLLLPAASMAGASTSGEQPGRLESAQQESARGQSRSEYLFGVYLDGKRIGEHRYEVTGAPGSERVRSEANFEFKLLFVTLYRYRHLANEAWQQGCLTHLTSATNDNGRAYEVAAGPQGAEEARPRLLLTRLEPDPQSRQLDDCPGTFAYWDLQRMSADALINTQTGELLPTRLVREGRERIDGHDAVRYRLEIEGMSTIQLWYRADDEGWLRLANRRDGRLLEYRLQANEQQPPSVAEDDTRIQGATGV